MKYLFSLCVGALILLTSCSSVQVSTDYDRAENFSKYRTFTLYKKGIDSLKLNDLDKRRVVNAVIAGLEERGLKLSEDGDLLVNIQDTYKERQQINNYGGSYPYGGWGGYGNRPYTTSRQYTEMRIVVDLVDKKQNKLVWQGLATGFNLDQLENKESLIPKAIEKMLYKYPPKSN